MSLLKNMGDDCKTSVAINPTEGAAGTTPINGAILDMSGFEGVQASIGFGAITAGAVTSVKFQQGNDAGGADMADVEGSAFTVPDSHDNGIAFVSFVKPRYRYVRVVVARATQNAVVGFGEYKQWTPATQAVMTHGAVVAGKSIFSPPNGTA